MPHTESVLSDVLGASAFTVVEFSSGYWQLPLQADSQKIHALMAPYGVVQPTCTVQGSCNSAQKFQVCVEPCFATLRDHKLAWIDDFLIYAKDETELLSVLESFLAICEKRNLVVSL